MVVNPLREGANGGGFVSAKGVDGNPIGALPDKNTLEDHMTIVDPVALAHPWVLTIRYHHVSNMPHVVDRVMRGK